MEGDWKFKPFDDVSEKSVRFLLLGGSDNDSASFVVVIFGSELDSILWVLSGKSSNFPDELNDLKSQQKFK